MITLTIDKNADDSARLRLTNYAVQGFSIPANGRFVVSLIDYLTGQTTPITSASTAPGGVSEARAALLGRAKADGVDVTNIQVVER